MPLKADSGEGCVCGLLFMVVTIKNMMYIRDVRDVIMASFHSTFPWLTAYPSAET